MRHPPDRIRGLHAIESQMNMNVVGRKRPTVGEWLLVGAILVFTVGATEFLGATQKLENAVVYTVLVFTALIIALRPMWGRRAFWHDLVLVFLFHLLGVVIVYHVLPLGTQGLHGLPLVEVGLVELTLLISVLAKRAMKSNSRFP
jgi:hypothetical protein